MYARFGTLYVKEGSRDAVIDILRRAADLVGALSGCRLYLVHEDPADPLSIVIYELWDGEEDHARSLEDESVRALIGEARPHLAGAPDGGPLRLAGGHGAPTG